MDSNKEYSWNVLLKFSWGHIVAFVAIIFIGYVIFMGVSYFNGGDFVKSFIVACVMMLALFITFIGAQALKGTSRNFKKSIVGERILVALCPVAFLCAMLPYNHFWVVFDNREGVEKNFGAAISAVRELFDDYDAYSNSRIEKYNCALDRLIKSGTFSNNHRECSFAPADIQKEGFVEALRLQLLSENTRMLRNEAERWIDGANGGASVWNVFLIANVRGIKEAIDTWNNKLVEYSKPVMSNEETYADGVEPFDSKVPTNAKEGIDDVINLYTGRSWTVSLWTIGTGIALFLCLLLPYFIQQRNTKAKGYVAFWGSSDGGTRSSDDDDDVDEAGTQAEDGASGGGDDIYGRPITW